MRLGRMLAFVVLAVLAGSVISQIPSALADDSANPFSAMWDAIFDLQSRDKDLQAQIDELRAERDALLGQTEPAFVSDPYAQIKVDVTDGRTLVYITVGNSGPDRAAGVKVTAFYLMPLFEINSIDGNQCEDKSRGIIECILGTLEAGQESVITIDATARESGEANTWTVDISTTTDDADYANNHVTYDFETGSGKPVEIPATEQPIEQQVTQEPAQEDSTNSTETKEPQESSGNQTSTENESEETSGNQTSNETVNDSGSNSTEAESSEQPEESSPEGATDDGAQEEQPGESETEQPQEQGTSEESGAEESQEGSSEESGGEESSSNESGSEDSGSSDSGDNGDEQQQESSGDESSGSEESGEGGSESAESGESPPQ